MKEDFVAYNSQQILDELGKVAKKKLSWERVWFNKQNSKWRGKS